ncbi:hypothetical protein GP486_007432 [Trichoglossum hirsutum]|uniref:Uncharacterized protein n=1 Tax=Trichoglossum hirsutum TaxID=265104 RepID=A0A9P8L2P8_9PEZI|nr:hypothetical protein GP486_007432 [Trichoglossum hirsutum]
MSTYTVLKFSPSKSSSGSAPRPPQRAIQPSPEKLSVPCTTVIVPQNHAGTTTEAGSPVKKKRAGKDKPVLGKNIGSDNFPNTSSNGQIDAKFEVQLGQLSQDFMKSLAVSKRVELSYSLVENGRPTLPPHNGFSELLGLFPTTFAADVVPPFVIIRVRTLPPKPWPFTVGGLPLWLTVDESADYFDRGRIGKGQKKLEYIDLQRREEFSVNILKEAITVFQDLHVKIRDIMWSPGFWRITVPDYTDLEVLPSFIARQVCFYKFLSEDPNTDPPALRSKVPQGVEYDDTFYALTPNALLRPGIMVSSSIRYETRDGKVEDTFKTTTSGILVVDRHGQPFITVATHGFEDDGLVYHPNPKKGSVIGKIVDRLLGTDISIVKLNPGLRYTNETFGTEDNPDGIKMSDISPCYPPHLRAYDAITMNNPFSGSCEGVVLGLGAMFPEEGERGYVLHQWYILENVDGTVDGSCGSPILDCDGQVVGLFRFKKENSPHCFGVSAMELRTLGYEICGGVREF